MVGITAYGVYIPRYRLKRKTISEAMGWFSPASLPGEKAVANCDEDSLTMAVAAGMDCLNEVDRSEVDGVYFATTTAPYREREGAAILATALDLPSQIRTADFANSLRSGTAAILSAGAQIQADGGGSILVCAADSRVAKPGSTHELVFGDGAAALLIGKEGVVASLEGSYSVSYDFPDHWRSEGDRFDRALEDRWIRDEGYTRFIPEAISGLLGKYQLKAEDFARVIYPGLYLRDHASIGRRLGFEPGQIQELLLTKIGETGSASPLMMLVWALEGAKPGDRILLASYGSGSQALFFRVSEEIEKRRAKRGFSFYLNSGKELTSYQKYAVFRGIMPVETGFRGEVGTTQLALAWRERKALLAFNGSRCRRCGTPQYPPQRVCVDPDCGAIDEMEDYRFSDKRGTLFTYTEDHLAFSLNPPQVYGAIDFDGGGRFTLDITDCEPGTLKVGMSMEMTLRRKYLDQARGIHGYFWKATPARD